MIYIAKKPGTETFYVNGTGNYTIGEVKDFLRKHKTIIFCGWKLTAEDKYKGCHDGRLWITATKDGQKDQDDTLTYLFNRLSK